MEENFNWIQGHFEDGFTRDRVCLQVQECLPRKWMDGGFLGGGGAGVEGLGPSDQGGDNGPSRECPSTLSDAPGQPAPPGFINEVPPTLMKTSFFSCCTGAGQLDSGGLRPAATFQKPSSLWQQDAGRLEGGELCALRRPACEARWHPRQRRRWWQCVWTVEIWLSLLGELASLTSVQQVVQLLNLKSNNSTLLGGIEEVSNISQSNKNTLVDLWSGQRRKVGGSEGSLVGPHHRGHCHCHHVVTTLLSLVIFRKVETPRMTRTRCQLMRERCKTIQNSNWKYWSRLWIEW